MKPKLEKRDAQIIAGELRKLWDDMHYVPPEALYERVRWRINAVLNYIDEEPIKAPSTKGPHGNR
jgi:hypothetical protein